MTEKYRPEIIQDKTLELIAPREETGELEQIEKIEIELKLNK